VAVPDSASLIVTEKGNPFNGKVFGVLRVDLAAEGKLGAHIAQNFLDLKILDLGPKHHKRCGTGGVHPPQLQRTGNRARDGRDTAAFDTSCT